MGGTKKQAFDAPRVQLFMLLPHELLLVTQKTDEFYDPKVENEIPDGAILDAAALGIRQNIVVHKTENDEAVVVAGNQRVKRALVVNALLGIKYEGPVKAVHAAIKRLAGTEIAKRIVELRGESGPMKVPAALHHGSSADAYGVKLAVDSWLQGDTKRQLMAKVQHMKNDLDMDVQTIKERTGLSLASISRYLKADLTKEPAPRKPMGKKVRPGARRIDAAFDALKDDSKPKLLLGWTLGKVSKAKLVEAFPELAEAVK